MNNGRRIDLSALLQWARHNGNERACRAIANSIITGAWLDTSAVWAVR